MKENKRIRNLHQDSISKKCVLLVFLLMCIYQHAQGQRFTVITPSNHTVYFQIENNAAEATYCSNNINSPNYGTSLSGTLIIPDSVEYNNISYPVTSIGAYAFHHAIGMDTVILPNTITTINSVAFSACADLASVTIPNSVTALGSYAFSACRNLSDLTIGESVVTIGYCAFGGDTSLVSVTLPNSVVTIGASAFEQDHSLRTVRFGSSVTNIGYACFNYCSNLDSLFFIATVPPSSMGDYWGTPDTLNITIPCGSYHSYSSMFGLHHNYYTIPTRDFSLTVNSSQPLWGTALIIKDSDSNEVRCDSSVVIKAFSNYGYHLQQWSNGNNKIQDTLFLTGDSIVTALFAKNTYTITAIPNDTTCGNITGSSSTEYLDSVTITAIPNYGYHFTAWNDGDTANPRTIEATKDSLFTAYFGYNQYSIILNVDTNIHGTVIGSGTYNYLSIQTITANANYGYHFTAWNDGDTTNPRTITLAQDTSFTALYAKNKYSVTGTTNDSIKGLVSGSTTVYYLDSVTITATANYGYHFTTWNDGDTANPRTIGATRDSLITAYFDYNQYSITLNVDTNIHGLVSGGGLYNYTSEQTITATANYGYHFTSWNDGDTTNPRTITLTQDTIFTALFAKNSYSVSVVSADTIWGNVTGNTTTEYLNAVSIAATANYGYHFSHWSDGDTTNPRIITLTQDTLLTAYFAKNWYSIICISDNETMGYVTGSDTAEYLDSVSLLASSNYGYHFSSWNDGDTNNPRVVCLTQDTSFTALFAKNQYTLTVQSNDEIQGSVSDGGVFDYLDTATIIASACEHYHFVRWDDGNMDNPREYVMVGDAILTAIFAIDTHTVTVTANDIARGMAEATGTEFVYGTPCTVTATAYTGYVFSRWSNGITANPYTFAVLEDTELTAIFEEEGTQGIDDVFDINGFVVYYKGRSIYIRGIEGQPLSVYGIDGRIIVTKQRATEQETIHAPSTGVYFIKVGEYPARKVVVVR